MKEKSKQKVIQPKVLIKKKNLRLYAEQCTGSRQSKRDIDQLEHCGDGHMGFQVTDNHSKHPQEHYLV